MRRIDEGAGHRHARLEELILGELRGLFRDDVSDPTVEGVRITRLALSVDYKHARVHYVVRRADSGTVRSIPGRMVRVAPFLRARLGEALELKRVPELSFVLDGAAPSEPEET